MRVALGQLDMLWEDKESSFVKAERMIEEAAESGCDVIIFPEMSFTGFSMNLKKIGEMEDDSLTVSTMKQFAASNHIAIAFGWAALGKEPGAKGTNRFTMVGQNGEMIADYAKTHPFTYGHEGDYYDKGTEIVTAPFLGRVISLFICYDLRFPEIFHIAARKADIIFVVANWPAIRSAHWETLLRARAIETQSYVVGVNCVGERDGRAYSGDSMAVDSIGNILGKMSNKEGILICDLDNRAWSLRKKFATAADRREDFYKIYFK